MFEHADSVYKKGKKEALGFLFGNFLDNKIINDDLVIPQQTATKISVSEAENDIEIIKKIKDIKAKKLFLHSKNDEVVPLDLAKKLFAAAGGPKKFTEVYGNHNNGVNDHRRLYLSEIINFLESVD